MLSADGGLILTSEAVPSRGSVEQAFQLTDFTSAEQNRVGELLADNSGATCSSGSNSNSSFQVVAISHVSVTVVQPLVSLLLAESRLICDRSSPGRQFRPPKVLLKKINLFRFDFLS